MSMPGQGHSPGSARRPPRRWVAFVALVLLLPAFVGVSIIGPARLVAVRHGNLYGTAGPGETLTAAGLSVRLHSAKIIRDPGADDLTEPLPSGTGLAVITFDVARLRPSAYSDQVACVVRLTDATGRVWTDASSATNIARIYATSGNRAGNQTCAQATNDGLTFDKRYRVEIRMVVADDITEPLTIDIRGLYQPRPRRFFRFRY